MRFVAEGIKVIQELIDSHYKLVNLYATEENLFTSQNCTIITEKELQRISTQKNPNKAVAIFAISPIANEPQFQGIVPVFDTLNDPGNLGTIIRTADWMGVFHIVLSEGSVDVYNPKVVQASMGSIARVSVHYVDILDWVSKQTLPIYGTFMEGNAVFSTYIHEGIILFGNEANGISDKMLPYIFEKICIPKLGGGESLNVALSAGIIMSQCIYSSMKD